MSDSAAYEAYYHLEDKFNIACNQLKLLNSRIAEIQQRYDRAAKDNRRSYRYTLRIRLVVMEGVRNMYYQYATEKADELDRAKQQIQEAMSDGEEFSTSEEEDEEEEEMEH